MWDRTVTRQQVLDAYPLVQVLEQDGIKLIGNGIERKALCPFHQEKTPSFSVNVVKGTFLCFGCRAGGSVIDYLAMKGGTRAEEVFKQLVSLLGNNGGFFGGNGKRNEPTGTFVCTYEYRDALGNEVLRKLRWKEPKDFRIERKLKNGNWVRGADGVQRVLYNLPEILAAKEGQCIWQCEGEKDCDNLAKLGFIATTNIDGAGKWMDGYNECLADKDVVLCGDNDKPGKDHIAKVMASLDGKVKRLRVITVPEPDKDISDYLARFGSMEAKRQAVDALLEKAAVIVQGSTVPILSMREMQDEYVKSVTTNEGYSFSRWLPSLGKAVRPLVPGDLVCFVGGTGCGKTCWLQNMAFWSFPLLVLLFEMELSTTLTFERFVAGAMRMTQQEVERNYREKGLVEWWENDQLSSIYTCPMAGLTVSKMEEITNRAELKMGQRPVLVMVDYAQLVTGTGRSKYEQMTSAMEDLKSLAKNTNTIVVVASQVQRPKDERNIEVGLYSGKESGQIENSCQLHIGGWRDKNRQDVLWLRVNKNTRGVPGLTFACNFDGARMLITERSIVDD